MLGKFGVIMADPPWEIHQDLPYGTMADEEMRRMGLGALQDEGVIFLWVTGAQAPAGHVGFRVLDFAPHGPGRAAGRGRHLPLGHRCASGSRHVGCWDTRRMGLGALQDEGVIFLWVTGALAPAGHVVEVQVIGWLIMHRMINLGQLQDEGVFFQWVTSALARPCHVVIPAVLHVPGPIAGCQSSNPDALLVRAESRSCNYGRARHGAGARVPGDLGLQARG